MNASFNSLPSLHMQAEVSEDELRDLLDEFGRQGISNFERACPHSFDKNTDKNTDRTAARDVDFYQEKKTLSRKEDVLHECAISSTPLESHNSCLKQQFRLWQEGKERKQSCSQHSAPEIKGSYKSALSDRESRTRQPRKKDASLNTFWHKRWRDLTRPQQLSVASHVAFHKGGSTFNLNFSPRREASLLLSKDFRKELRDLISSSLRKFGRAELPIALALEADHDGRLHIHGVIGSQLSEEELKMLRKAMCEIFGEDKDMKRVRQLQTMPITNAEGWTDYMLKDQRHTNRHLGIALENQIFLNQAMIRLAHGVFEELRKSKPGESAA